jgi:hypothetical protein
MRGFRRLAVRWSVIIAATALSTFGFSAATASAAATPPDGSTNYQFTTLDNAREPAFNQLLGINDSGLIAGYFGSGEGEHPNKGYLLSSPYGQSNYVNENFPHSAQTQVTGLDNKGITVGFYVDKKGDNFGFDAVPHHGFQTVQFPAKHGKPAIDQLLGVNDRGVAVGFYTDASGVNHGYSYDIFARKFHQIVVSGDTNVTASAINDEGDIAGFATNSQNVVEAFLELANGHLVRLSFPGATATQAFGVNAGDEVVGTYTDTAGMHGFVWTPGFGFQTVDDPDGANATAINGVNDHGELVGFYTDQAGNTDGLLATPKEG